MGKAMNSGEEPARAVQIVDRAEVKMHPSGKQAVEAARARVFPTSRLLNFA